MVWRLWLDRGSEGRKCDLCGSLSLTDGVVQSNQLITLWLTCSQVPLTGSEREEGLITVLSNSEVQSSAEMYLFHGWKPFLKMSFSFSWDSALRRTAIFGVSVTLFVRYLTWMPTSTNALPPPRPIPRALIPFACKISGQFIKHKDEDTLKHIYFLTLPPSQFQNSSKTTL